uniref:WD-repeat protein n=1 Tax=Gemmata sp. Wa1-1 TaxID=235140 RepID=Q5EUI1_9BACT|nr:WD-repeat protein [Gemmata sp. Wa1-1]
MDSEGHLTRTGILVGTPAYMAPEQADAQRAREVGPACDVYGLGAILYECLTGRPPFRADTLLATVLQVRTEEPVAPRRVQPTVPRDLETICLKCLHKDPRRRYASAEALADDLQRYLDGKPVVARPAGAIERGVKWARRRPTLAALLVTVPVLVALGFSGVFWQWRETVGALRETREEQKKTLRAHEATKAHLYLNQVSLAWNELRSNSGGRAEALLRDTDPALRNWEWHYLQRHAQTDLFTLVGHNNEIQALAWSPDGQLIASGSGHWSSGLESEFKIWDARTGQLLRTITQEIGTVLALAFSPDGTVLASGSHDRVVRLWNPRTGQLVKELPGHSNRVSRVVFSPDGKRLASAALDNTARIWDLETGKTLHVLRGHKDNVFCLEFSPDGKMLVTGDRKHVARVWDPATGKLLRTETGPGDLRATSFSPDGAWLAFGTFQGSIWVWDLTQPNAKPVIHNPVGSI